MRRAKQRAKGAAVAGRPAEQVEAHDVVPLLESVDELIAEVGGLDRGLASRQERRAQVDVQAVIERLHTRGALRLLVKARGELGLLHDEAAKKRGCLGDG